MKRTRSKFSVAQGKCIVCGEASSAKAIWDGEAIAIFDGVEGQIAVICTYHLSRYNPNMPKIIGEGLIQLVEDLRITERATPKWMAQDVAFLEGQKKEVADNATHK